jgi:hypothetical protein
MGKHNRFTEDKYAEYALRIHKKDASQTIPKIAAAVFGVSFSYAKQNAWNWMKHPSYIREKDRLEQLDVATDPMTKGEKLVQNRILIDEAYRLRDKDAYIRLVRMDNEMQGHTRSDEQGDAKIAQGNALIGELMTQLREKNKGMKNADKVIDVIEE